MAPKSLLLRRKSINCRVDFNNDTFFVAISFNALFANRVADLILARTWSYEFMVTV